MMLEIRALISLEKVGSEKIVWLDWNQAQVSFFLKKKLKVSLKYHFRFDIVKSKYQNGKILFSLLLFCLPFFLFFLY